MAYTLLDIRNRVKDRLDDQDFSNSLLNNFINDEQREILNYYNLPFNRTFALHTINQGDDTITLPADHQTTLGLRITGPQNYDVELTQYFLPYNRFKDYFREQQYRSQNNLRYWTLNNNQEIEFAWQADRTFTLEQDYIKTAAELENDNDVPEIPEEFRELLILGAYIRALEVNDDNDIAQYQYGKKELLIQSLVKRYAPSQQKGKTTVLRNTFRGI